MKRLLVSVIGGIVFPLLYAILAVSLTINIQNPTTDRLIGLPVRWPVVLLHRFVPFNFFLFRDENRFILLVYIIGANVAVYSLVTFVVVTLFLKRRAAGRAQPPPQPPQFAAD